KRRKAPAGACRRGPSANLKKQLDQRSRELADARKQLADALQQHTATADVLKVISRSTFDLQSVLDTLVESAARLCESEQANIARPGSDHLFYVAATYGLSPKHQADQKKLRFKPERGSLIGRVLLTRGPVHIEDAATDREYMLALARKIGGFHSMLGVPLMREGVPIGVFGLGRKEVRPFTEKQVELLTTFADQAVIAIENTRLLNELRDSLQQQTATTEVLGIISSSPGELEPVFRAMLENATRICEAKCGNLFLREQDSFRAVARHGAPAAYAEFRQREPVIDIRNHPDVPLARVARTKEVV